MYITVIGFEEVRSYKTVKNIAQQKLFCNLDSGVGAGIDSYYEYCLKAYILLGDESYLHRFNKVIK